MTANNCTHWCSDLSAATCARTSGRREQRGGRQSRDIRYLDAVEHTRCFFQRRHATPPASTNCIAPDDMPVSAAAAAAADRATDSGGRPSVESKPWLLHPRWRTLLQWRCLRRTGRCTCRRRSERRGLWRSSTRHSIFYLNLARVPNSRFRA